MLVGGVSWFVPWWPSIGEIGNGTEFLDSTFKNLKNKVKMNYPAFSTLNVIILLRNGFCLQHGGGPPAFVMLASWQSMTSCVFPTSWLNFHEGIWGTFWNMQWGMMISAATRIPILFINELTLWEIRVSSFDKLEYQYHEFGFPCNFNWTHVWAEALWLILSPSIPVIYAFAPCIALTLDIAFG